MEPRISIITLGVKSLQVSREFYEEGLGWKVSSVSAGDIVFFNLNGTKLALYPWTALAEDAQMTPEGQGFRGFTLAHNVPNKEMVVQILSKAEKAGATIIKPAQDVFWGGHSGYFSDPDGYLWEIAWNPHIPLSKDGNLQFPE